MMTKYTAEQVEIEWYNAKKGDIETIMGFIHCLPRDIELVHRTVHIGERPHPVTKSELLRLLFDYYSIDEEKLEKEKLQILEELGETQA